MILISEPVHFGATHVQVNSAFVAMLCQIFNSKNVVVYAENGHVEELKLKLETTMKIKFVGFKNYNPANKFSWYKKIFGEMAQIIKVLRLAQKEKPELLVWLSLFPTGHFLVSILHRLFLPKQKQIIILHGELEYLQNTSPKNSESFLKKTLNAAFYISNDATKYLVLGNSILQNLNVLKLPILKKVFAIRHPFLYNQFPKQLVFSLPLKVCVFGALSLKKNDHFIFHLASQFQNEIKAGQIQFQTIGLIQAEMKAYFNQLVDCQHPDEFLSQAQFEKQIAQNHIALFFYDNQSYVLSASGALYEAINQRMPVISLRNDYFAELLQQYPMGEMADSTEQIREILIDILKNPETKLKYYQDAIIGFVQQNSFLLQTQKLNEILTFNRNLQTNKNAATIND